MPWVMSGIGGGGGGAASPAATFLSYAASAAPNILQRVRASLERWRATQGPGCLLRVFERLGPRVTHESAANVCDHDETLILIPVSPNSVGFLSKGLPRSCSKGCREWSACLTPVMYLLPVRRCSCRTGVRVRGPKFKID